MTPTRRPATTPVSVETGPAYEFLMSLVTLAEVEHRDLVEVGPRWLLEVEERAGKTLVRRLHELSQGTGDHLIHLVPLAYDAPAPHDVPTLLAHLSVTDAEEIVLRMVGYYEYHYRRMTPSDVMRAAVGGDGEAVAEFLRTTEEYGAWHAFLAHVLERRPSAIKRELLHVLAEWHERVWSVEERQLLPILERDAEAKRLMARELPFDRFVEVATNGVQFVPHPGIDRLVLIPTYVNRPWVSNTEHRGAMILIYPVADESVAADPDAPPLRLVRLAKALADEKRLRIMRLLAERPRSLLELADEFGVPKTTMHHHLVTLRSAGLVSVGSGTKQYRLRQDALPSLVQSLGGYIDPAKAATAEAGAARNGDEPRGSRRRTGARAR